MKANSGPARRMYLTSLTSLTSLASLAWPLLSLSALTACMHTPPPMDPSESSEDEAPADKKPKNPDAISTTDNSGNMLGSGGVATPRGEHATIKDDTKKESVSCGGANIADLVSVIAQISCVVPKATPDTEQPKDLKDSLEIKASLDLPKVPAGSKANVTVTFHNKGKADLPLDFVVDPEPHFDLELHTMKGARADNPPGNEPALPDSVTSQPAPERSIARVTLAPGGSAKLVLPWDAVKYKWASADRAKGALPGQHYPREVAGPLPRGKYSLKVVTPLVGVAEGSDHEVSQPRVAVEVGGP